MRQNHGIAVHGPIVPKRSQLGVADNERQANEVVFGFVLPYHGDTHDFSQPMPNGIGPSTLIIEQKVAGLTVSGPGVGAREERELGGHKYWVMPVAAIPPGGALTFTLTGLPSTDIAGRDRRRRRSSLLLIGGAVVFARRPHGGAGGKRVGRRARRAQLRREARGAVRGAGRAGADGARGGHAGAPADQRKQLVARLEQVYRDLAALDEPRAA